MDAMECQPRPEVLAIFGEFVRLNPSLSMDGPIIPRVFEAYEKTMPAPVVVRDPRMWRF
jgi:hypothetical protein